MPRKPNQAVAGALGLKGAGAGAGFGFGEATRRLGLWCDGASQLGFVPVLAPSPRAPRLAPLLSRHMTGLGKETELRMVAFFSRSFGGRGGGQGGPRRSEARRSWREPSTQVSLRSSQALEGRAARFGSRLGNRIQFRPQFAPPPKASLALLSEDARACPRYCCRTM